MARCFDVTGSAQFEFIFQCDKCCTSEMEEITPSAPLLTERVSADSPSEAISAYIEKHHLLEDGRLGFGEFGQSHAPFSDSRPFIGKEPGMWIELGPPVWATWVEYTTDPPDMFSDHKLSCCGERPSLIIGSCFFEAGEVGKG